MDVNALKVQMDSLTTNIEKLIASNSLTKVTSTCRHGTREDCSWPDISDILLELGGMPWLCTQ